MTEYEDEKPVIEKPTIEDYLKVMIIGQQRIYDTLLVLLASENREAYANLIAKHERYETVGPLPYEEA